MKLFSKTKKFEADLNAVFKIHLVKEYFLRHSITKDVKIKHIRAVPKRTYMQKGDKIFIKSIFEDEEIDLVMEVLEVIENELLKFKIKGVVDEHSNEFDEEGKDIFRNVLEKSMGDGFLGEITFKEDGEHVIVEETTYTLAKGFFRKLMWKVAGAFLKKRDLGSFETVVNKIITSSDKRLK